MSCEDAKLRRRQARRHECRGPIDRSTTMQAVPIRSTWFVNRTQSSKQASKIRPNCTISCGKPRDCMGRIYSACPLHHRFLIVVQIVLRRLAASGFEAAQKPREETVMLRFLCML